MTMSERCLIPYKPQLSAAKFIAQTRFGETARAPNVVHRVQMCSWIEVVVCERSNEPWKMKTLPLSYRLQKERD